MSPAIYIVNPNSSSEVSAIIDAAAAPLRAGGGPPISTVTVDDGPPGINSDHDADAAVPPLLRRLAALEAGAAAFVIACFSDPGLQAAREQSRHPVFGSAEAGVLTALTLGRRFGVIATVPAAVSRHGRYFAAMGVTSRLAGERPVGLGVNEIGVDPATFERLATAGHSLVHDHGADVLVLGCASMARFRSPLQDAAGVPVVDPIQAAVALALGRLRMDPLAGPFRRACR